MSAREPTLACVFALFGGATVVALVCFLRVFGVAVIVVIDG